MIGKVMVPKSLVIIAIHLSQAIIQGKGEILLKTLGTTLENVVMEALSLVSHTRFQMGLTHLAGTYRITHPSPRLYLHPRLYLLTRSGEIMCPGLHPHLRLPLYPHPRLHLLTHSGGITLPDPHLRLKLPPD